MRRRVNPPVCFKCGDDNVAYELLPEKYDTPISYSCFTCLPRCMRVQGFGHYRILYRKPNARRWMLWVWIGASALLWAVLLAIFW